jgi:hypothetical protein
MRLTVLVAFVAAALTAPAAAQDTKTKSRTNIKADDAKVMSLVGCVRHELVSDSYLLVGTVTAAGDDLTTKTKVKTDVDNDKTKVQAKSETKGNDAVGTAGAASTYLLLAAPNVNLAPHVGQQVRISALQVEKGHGDADVKIKDETKVDRDDAPDSKSTSKTKLELPRSPNSAYSVVSVTPLGRACAQ